MSSPADEPSPIPLTSAQQEELDARLDDIDEGDEAGIPWDDLLARVQDRGA